MSLQSELAVDALLLKNFEISKNNEFEEKFKLKSSIKIFLVG
jgi:hypothetical protein